MPTKKTKWRNRDSDRKRGERGRVKGVWSDEIERRDRNGSMRGDKQSLGRIPLGTKLYSPSRVNPSCRFYTRRSLRVSCTFSSTPGSFPRLALSLSFPLTFSPFQMSNTDSPPAKTTSRCIAPRQSSWRASRRFVLFSLTRERKRDRQREKDDTGSCRPTNSQTALETRFRYRLIEVRTVISEIYIVGIPTVPAHSES